MKKLFLQSLVVPALLLAHACGEGHPLVSIGDEPEVIETPEELPTLIMEPEVVVVEPVGPSPSLDAGTADAGGPWSHCVRHRKAKGHGKGLAKSCY